MGIWTWRRSLRWLDEEYLSAFEKKEVDSRIAYQEPFGEMVEKRIPYSIASDESLEDNTYLSYNKVIGTSLDRELYLAFQILDYALLSAPGAPLKKALTEAGIGKDIMGSYDNGVLSAHFLCDRQECQPVPEGGIPAGDPGSAGGDL